MTGNTSLAQPRDLGTTSYTRANPLARLAPAFALALVNAATLDLVTHTLTLLVTVLVLPLTGLTLPRLTRVAWPLFVAAATLLVVNTLAYPSPGIQDADLRAGALTAVRLLAVTLPGLVAFTTIDAVDLVDSLVQQLRLSPRFGYGALAAMRLMPLLADDWSTQTMAARARGVSARGPVRRLRMLAQRVLGLLVTAVRRATRLAVALDGRGFDGSRRATARPSSWTAADTAWCVGGLLAALAVAGVAIAAGTWQSVTG